MDNDGRNSPATKGDLQDFAQQLRSEFRSELQEATQQLRSELGSELQEATAQLRSEFQHGFDDLKEAIRDSQTEILKGIYGYLQTTEVKLKDTQTGEAALRERVNILESRLLAVEMRLNLPPRS